jgi:hypothetical protein
LALVHVRALGSRVNLSLIIFAKEVLDEKAMGNSWYAVVVLMLGSFLLSGFVRGQEKTPQNSHLTVLWSSSDPDVAHQVCFMYTGNAKK